MFSPHPSIQLTKLFSLKPYQGAAPENALSFQWWCHFAEGGGLFLSIIDQ